jgi:hypothetical protein
VIVAVEIPEQEQSRLDEFLHSGGSEADRARLLEGEFWRRPQQDGRSSRAVLQLLDDLRQMIHDGYSVTAFAFDASPGQGADRNAAMAENIEARREHAKDALFVVLSASAHLPGGGGSASSLLARLAQKERSLTSLAVAFDGGAAWTCSGPSPDQIKCGAHSMRAHHPGPMRFLPEGPHARSITRWPHPTPDGDQGAYYLGIVSASPPAVQSSHSTRSAKKLLRAGV